MTSNEALNIVKGGGVGYTINEYDEALKLLEKNLKILEILSRHLMIIDDKVLCFVSDDNEEDNIVIKKWATDILYELTIKNPDKYFHWDFDEQLAKVMRNE